MTEAIGYTRLSQQSDRSIEAQKRNIREYCAEHDLDLDRIYNDGEGSSGFDSAREQYQLVRQRVMDGDCDAVVVDDKRRLARDIDEVMRLIPELRTQNIELHTRQDGQLDLSDPLKAAIEILQAAAAHKEKLKEIQKSIEAVEERLENGYDHGRARFGMEYREDGKFQVPAENFEQVERVLELRDQNVSYPEIEARTGVSSSTAKRIVDRREWYEERAEQADYSIA